MSSHSRLEYTLEDSLVSNKESTSDPPSKEASPSRQHPREIVVPNVWSIHDFPVDMSDKVFSKLRPCIQIPNNVPIKKGDIGERCYDGRSSDVGFYETAFIVGLHLPLYPLHCQLASYMGVSISQIAPNAWRIFIGGEALWGQLSGGITP